MSTVSVGALRAAVVEGQAAPAELGGEYGRPLGCSVNDAGEVAFAADLVSSSAPAAVVMISAGAPTVIATAGGRFRSFGDVDLADGGLCLFSAGDDLFLATPSGIQPVWGDYLAVAQPTITSWVSGSERRYLIAFVARLAGGRKTVVMHPSHGDPVECLSTGMRLGTDVVEDVSISRLGLGLCCVATMRGEAGRYRTALIIDAGCVISGAQLGRLLPRPAVNVQLGFVTARLDDGRTALYSRPPMAKPEILVATGDPVPGEPETIGWLGSPVASSGVPNSGRFGLAAPMRTTTGRSALWVGTFEAQLPLDGVAMTPLLDGDKTDDGLAVHDFTPIKLTNTGIVLVRTRTTTGRRALLLLDGLWPT